PFLLNGRLALPVELMKRDCPARLRGREHLDRDVDEACGNRSPQARGLVMYTLHHAAEIRSIDTVEELNAVATTVKPEEMKLAQQVISTFEGPLDLANYKDEYREGLQRIIEAKIAGEEIVAPAV